MATEFTTREPQSGVEAAFFWLHKAGKRFYEWLTPFAEKLGWEPQHLIWAVILCILGLLVLRHLIRGAALYELKKTIMEKERLAAEERRKLDERIAKLESVLLAVRDGVGFVDPPDGLDLVALRLRAERAEKKIRRLVECMVEDMDEEDGEDEGGEEDFPKDDSENPPPV